VISARILDQAVLEKLQLVLNHPEVIGAEIARLRRDDPTKADRDAVERRLSEVERLRGNLVRRVAAIDDDDIAASLLAEMATLGKQQSTLISEREQLESERASWDATQTQLRDLEDWCRQVASNVDLLNYEGRRLALTALSVEARVWSTNHTPRWEIKMLPDVLPVTLSDLPRAADGGLVWAHVDGYTRRGCARSGGHRVGRP
jgi:hypothetical protein